ncbi:MAG: hypothetical protein FWF77_07010 [Defluviitaleaceae bacterium]|nr:hypothetical protein [Defluviitaleaceae bacterium]
MKKIFLALLILALAAAFTACAGCDEDDAPDRDDLSHELMYTRELAHARDLGGMEITIARMPGFPEECADTFELHDWMDDDMREQVQALWDNRREMEERYNFRIRYVGLGGFDFGATGDRGAWMEIEQDFIDGIENEIRAGNRDYTVWNLSAQQSFRANAAGLFAPIPTELFDASEAEWNRCVWQWSMRGGSPHAFSPQGERWPSGGGIMFNMRLLEGAGLPPDLPFTLQASGEWTWDALEDVARQVAAVPRMDSVIVPLVALRSQDFAIQALTSNNADFAVLDPETGLFADATNTPEFSQTMEWLVQMRDERLVSEVFRSDADGMWVDGLSLFRDEEAAMVASPFHFFADLPHEEWGFVAFPKGPNAQTHYTPTSRHPFYVIPYFFSPQEVEDIVFAIRMWYRLPETENPDWMHWANEWFENADPRSISESMVNFTENPALQRITSPTMMPWAHWEESFSSHWDQAWEWYNRGDWQTQELDTRTAHQIINDAQAEWNEFLQRINN